MCKVMLEFKGCRQSHNLAVRTLSWLIFKTSPDPVRSLWIHSFFNVSNSVIFAVLLYHFS